MFGKFAKKRPDAHVHSAHDTRSYMLDQTTFLSLAPAPSGAPPAGGLAQAEVVRPPPRSRKGRTARQSSRKPISTPRDERRPSSARELERGLKEHISRAQERVRLCEESRAQTEARALKLESELSDAHTEIARLTAELEKLKAKSKEDIRAALEDLVRQDRREKRQQGGASGVSFDLRTPSPGGSPGAEEDEEDRFASMDMYSIQAAAGLRTEPGLQEGMRPRRRAITERREASRHLRRQFEVKERSGVQVRTPSTHTLPHCLHVHDCIAHARTCCGGGATGAQLTKEEQQVLHVMEEEVVRQEVHMHQQTMALQAGAQAWRERERQKEEDTFMYVSQRTRSRRTPGPVAHGTALG